MQARGTPFITVDGWSHLADPSSDHALSLRAPAVGEDPRLAVEAHTTRGDGDDETSLGRGTTWREPAA
jgi:hypothetical protein